MICANDCIFFRHLCMRQSSNPACCHRPPPLLQSSPYATTVTSVRSYAKDKGGRDKKGKGGKPKVPLKDEDMIPVIEVHDMRDEFAAITEGLKESYIKTLSIRSGTGIEDLQIEFDGQHYPLKELANISRKTSNTLIINLTSMPDAIKPVIEAINSSGMNVNPQQEGTVIYINLPRVTREHREILAKNAKTLFTKAKDELAKVMNKYVREANEAKLLKNISAELVFNTIENIRWAEQQALAQCQQHLDTKVKELLGDKE